LYKGGDLYAAEFLRTGWFGFRNPVGLRRFILSTPVQTAPGCNPPCYVGTGALSRGRKVFGHGLEQQPPSDTEVINKKYYMSNPLLCLHAILQGDLYIFTLYFSSDIIRSDQVKDDMCYTEREVDQKMLYNLCKTKI